MTVTVANTTLTNTFDYWRNRTNELADAMTTKAVTTESNTAIGNAAISGTFTANVITLANSTVNTSIAVPTSTQISNGQYFLNANGNWSVISNPLYIFETSGTSQQEIDNYEMSSYSTAEYLIHMTNNNANGYQTTKLLTIHNGTSAFSTEYSTLVTNNSLGVFSVSTNTTHVRLLVTPTSSNTSINFYRVIL